MRKHILIWIALFSLLSLTSGAITDDTRIITGIVVEKYSREPIIGASIVIKGTTNGTISNIEGEFKLEISPTGTNVLVVSYIGYTYYELTLNPDQSHYMIELSEESSMLEEVAIVGYGTLASKQITSALSGAIRGVTINKKEKEEKSITTWKRSGMKDNSLRLQVGDNDFIPAEAIQLAVQVDGFRVRVLMDCFFYNDKGSMLEGTFKLKLPTEATPFYFAFGETEYINSDEEDKETTKQIPYNSYNAENFNLTYQGITEQDDRIWEDVKEARIVSRQKAAKAYEQTVSANIDPALMEWGGADVFSCRVYPLLNDQLHRIVIGYDLNMTEALNFREYILSIPESEKEVKLDMKIYDSSGLTTSISPVLDVMAIDKNYKFYSIVNPDEKEFTIRYNHADPVLLIQPDDINEEINIPYFAAGYRVELPEIPQENLPTDAIFMLDVSISSNPDKFNVWFKLLKEVLENNEDVIQNFALLTFNIESRWYIREYQKNNLYNRQNLLEYVNNLALEGATDLGSALQEASNPDWMKKGANKPKHIFLLSDADCNWGETRMHTFKPILFPGNRIHTYKTGLSGTNTAILNYLSRISDGFAFTVTGEEEAKLSARSFRYKPWFIEHIEAGKVKDFLISGQPVQLYNGQKLIFSGREIPTGAFHIDVTNGTEKRRLTYNPKETIQSPLVSRIYGQIASSYLENYGFMAEESAINYSTYYRVPGQYTSFLMLESDYDYDEWGIDDDDAISFVKDSLIADIIKEIENNSLISLLGNGKNDFITWLRKLDENNVINPDEEFFEFVNSLPEDVFKVVIKPRSYRVSRSEQQTDEEKELLEDEDIRFDNLLKIAKRRNRKYGNPDALKLLSSVVERNAGDLQAIRDVAMIAIEWGMPEHAYYMMRRIIDWRQEEGIAYITAADALAEAGYPELALIYYYLCIDTMWDGDYGSLPDMAAFKCLRYINQLQKNKDIKLSSYVKEFIPIVKELALGELTTGNFDEDDADDTDIIIMVSWNINDTDIDLHVIEPTGETCYYGNSNTQIGGKLSIDVTDGYGPEMYVLKKAPKGYYSVILDYYSDNTLQSASKAKAYVEVYRNWGRKNEKLTRKVIELRKDSENDFYDNDEKQKRKRAIRFYVK